MSEIRTNDIISETGLGPVGFSSGLNVGTAITCSAITGNINVGSAISMYASSGIVSATKFYGDGANLSNLPASGATLSGSTDNTVVTVTGANAMQGEADLKWDGTSLKIKGNNTWIRENQFRFNCAAEGHFDHYTTGQKMIFRTSASSGADTNCLEIFSTGNVEVSSGNLVIGTAGKGVDFSATANAGTTGATMTSELLDWYEEGTWTPSITFGGTSAFSGGSMGSSLGSYTRIGRLVVANFDTVINNKGSSGGLVHLNGLPFQSGSGAYRGGTCLAFNTWMNTDQKCSRTRMYLGDNRTFLQLLWNSLDNLNNSDCNTSGQICGVITYQVP